MVALEQSNYGISHSKFTSYTNIDQLLWLLISMWLIVDSVNGFILLHGMNIPFSQLFKLIILMLVVVRLRHRVIMLLLVSLIYTSGYVLHLISINNDFSESVLSLSRFLSLVYLYFYFRFSFRCFPQQSACNGKNMLIVSWGVLAANVILGLMGYGASSYWEDRIDLGVKGFFFAANELGGIMAVLTPFLFYLILKRLYGLKLVITYVIVMSIGILIGTKTSILATLLSAVAVPLLYMSPRKRFVLLLVLVVIVFFSIPYVVVLFEESSIGAIERWSYYYDSGGLSKLVFSGRDFLSDIKEDQFNRSGFLIQLFGMGSEGVSVERDHLDALFTFGYLGFVLLTSFFSYLLISAYRHRHNNSLMRVVIFSDLLVLGIGYMAGHVWFSAMASVYIALLNAFSFLRSDGILFGK